MTQKLYDQDAYLAAFTATVLSCEKTENGYAVVLDRTAFFPEEGGQTSDTGTLDGARVTGVSIRGGVITHETDAPLEAGKTVEGKIDWDARFGKMQNHTAEHMFSGICHALYGCENVGFHLGSRDMTVDFDIEVSREDLSRAETLVNEAIVKNLPVLAEYPAPEKLKTMQYRAKLALTEGVRVVSIPGVDACACCAPHVSSTGQIGILKMLDVIRYKGGVRVHLLAGFAALEDYRLRYRATANVGAMLSVPSTETVAGVEKLQAELAALRAENARLTAALLEEKVRAVRPTDGNLVHFDFTDDSDVLRGWVNLAVEKCGGIAAAFGGEDGNYRYVIGAKHTDLRAAAREINAALSGRGGGTPEMIRGSAAATKEQILAYFGAEEV